MKLFVWDITETTSGKSVDIQIAIMGETEAKTLVIFNEWHFKEYGVASDLLFGKPKVLEAYEPLITYF